MANLAADLLEFGFPQRCPGCGASSEPHRLLCAGCQAAVPRLAMPLCARCLARGADPSSCSTHAAYRVWPAWIYDERAALLIQALKYEGRAELAPPLGVELARVVPPAPRADLVLEVPLHRARRRERGYNQAALLADALSHTSGVPRLPDALERVRATRPQARLDPRQRRDNVAGAFRVRQPEWLAGRTVLIVDDVMTTGSTLAACLETLAGAGARAAGVVLAWAQ
jgi:ComF family protein